VLRRRWFDPIRPLALAACLVALPACGLTKPVSPLAGLTRLPAFPDPAPASAASVSVADVVAAGPQPMADAHRRLTAALELAGFERWSVYAFRDGFALITQWERIDDDGRPTKDRFVARHPKRVRPEFDFDNHVQELFNAPDGDYRLFVFTVTGSDAEMSADVPIDGDDVGAGELPAELATKTAADRSAEAHVYVFRQRGSGKADTIDSALDGATHLARARIEFAGAP
jgi:hypothetical protein